MEYSYKKIAQDVQNEYLNSKQSKSFDMFDLKQKNLEVLNVRDQLIKENKNFGIKGVKMPPYYDWVNVK